MIDFEQRQARALPTEKFVDGLLPTMFASAPAAQDVQAFRAAMYGFQRAGFRALARACAVDVRDALPDISCPALLIYGGRDERAPQHVANQMHEAIPGSTLGLVPTSDTFAASKRRRNSTASYVPSNPNTGNE